MQRSSNADELKELIERGSGLNEAYGGQTRPARPTPNGGGSPYAQGRPIGERPRLRKWKPEMDNGQLRRVHFHCPLSTIHWS